MSKTIDRLIQFVQHTGLSARQFDLSIGVSNGYTLRMQKNKASIGSDVLEKILEIYPQLNVAWLLTGTGAMIRQEELDVFDEPTLVSEQKKDEIESIIRRKIKEYQEKEYDTLLKEVSEAIVKANKKQP